MNFVTTHSAEETQEYARRVAATLKEGDVLLLEGDLGAGKTTFIQGLAQGLGVPEEVMTHSPTFTLVNEYPAKINLVHVDLYRIDHLKQIQELGIEEYLDGHRIVAVEWANKAPSFWPANAIQVKLKSLDSHSRQIMIAGLR